MKDSPRGRSGPPPMPGGQGSFSDKPKGPGFPVWILAAITAACALLACCGCSGIFIGWPLLEKGREGARRAQEPQLVNPLGGRRGGPSLRLPENGCGVRQNTGEGTARRSPGQDNEYVHLGFLDLRRSNRQQRYRQAGSRDDTYFRRTIRPENKGNES
jgi:hypothetical protein